MGYQTIKEVVVSKLREQVLAGTLGPGEELTTKKLASQFDCSLTPIREALTILRAEGLVVGSRHKSVTVAKLDVNELIDIYQMRAFLAGHAVSLAMSNVDEKLEEKLKKNLQEQKVAYSRNDFRTWIKLNQKFHDAIYRYAGNSTLLELIELLQNRTVHYVKTYTKLLNRTEAVISEHEQIINAIFSGDRDKARELMEKHFHNLVETLIPYLKEKRSQK